MSNVIDISHNRCIHTKFKVDETLEHVECGLCGKQLNPMWVLIQFGNTESRYFHRINMLKDQAEKAKAKAKNRCKCEHCGKMTKIQKHN